MIRDIHTFAQSALTYSLCRGAFLANCMFLLYFSHATRIKHAVEEISHLILKPLINSAIAIPDINLPQDLIKNPHDEIAILPTLPEPEGHRAPIQVVKAGLLCIIHLPNARVHIPIDIQRQRHWIFIQHILKHFLLQVDIDPSEMLSIQPVPLR